MRLRYLIVLLGVFVLISIAAQAASDPFASLKKDSWAYKSIQDMVKTGIIKKSDFQGIGGKKDLTRYEAAMLVTRILEKIEGLRDSTLPRMTRKDVNTLEKLTVEFADELALLGVKLDQIESDVRNLKKDMSQVKKDVNEIKKIVKNDSFGKFNISGDYRIRIDYQPHKEDTIKNNWKSEHRVATNMFTKINDDVSTFLRLENDFIWNSFGMQSYGRVDQAIVKVDDFFTLFDLKLGRQQFKLGHGLVINDDLDGIHVSRKIDHVKVTVFAFDKGTNDVGTMNYYPYDDTYEIKTQGAPAYAWNAANNTTFYTTPDSTPFFNSDINTDTDRNSNHAGTSIYPNNAAVSRDMLTVLNNGPNLLATAANTQQPDGAGRYYQGIAQDPAGENPFLQRDWGLVNKSGFSVLGINVDYDISEHKFGFYTLWEDYKQFDPYTRLGDPFLTMLDYDNNGTIDTTAPEAHTRHSGFTLDGPIFDKLDYFFEYVNFDPDIDSVSVNPLTPFNKATWLNKDIGTGNAFILGTNWKISDIYKLTLMYGRGDEQFMSSSINFDYRFLGMEGRWPALSQNLYTPNNDLYGSSSLQGIRDFLIKFDAHINPNTTGKLQYENVNDYDSNPNILVSGTETVTGHKDQSYHLVTARVEHKYRKNTNISLEITNKTFTDDAINEALDTDTADSGGWIRIRSEIQVKF